MKQALLLLNLQNGFMPKSGSSDDFVQRLRDIASCDFDGRIWVQTLLPVNDDCCRKSSRNSPATRLVEGTVDAAWIEGLSYCNRRVDDVFVRSQRIHDVSYCHTVIRFTSKTYSYTTQFTHSSCQTLMPTYLNCVYVFRQTSGVMGRKSFYYHMTTYSYSTTLYYCREHIPVQCCAPVLLGASLENIYKATTR